MLQTSKKIRLGICMAGAVSAGAYTAGVIDYLMETLERWQQQKDIINEKRKKGEPLSDDEQLVPMHDVVIEVLSGASAGGMTAAVLAYSMNDDTYFTKRKGQLIKGNYPVPQDTDQPTKLYNAWINMVDDKGSTFKELMNPKDAAPLNHMKSLLNSGPIDEIAERAIPKKIDFKPPAYVSDHVSVILSVTNLEGIPIDIRFSNVDKEDPTCNVLTMHSGFLHYQFHPQALLMDYPAEVVSEETKNHLAAAAKATGAFPFGLSNRKIVIQQRFFNDFKKRLKDTYKMEVNLQLKDGENYVFNAVDGGAINNEPIGTTVRILDCKKKEYHPDDEQYVILIDPFPTVTNAAERAPYFEPKEYTLLEQAKRLFSAIRNQSMFKQEDLLNGLEMDKNRYLIYPTKRKYYFLACGLIQGFSGFLKRAFRQHDYQLGRKNCQAFLRFYFSETLEEFQRITGSELPADQFLKWRYNVNFGKADLPPSWRIPLIPDILLLESDAEIETPAYNGLTTAEISEANSLIQERMSAILDESYPFLQARGKSISSVLGWFMGVFPRLFKGKILRPLEKKVSNYLHATFYPQSLKQDQLLLFYRQQILTQGGLYQKTKGVWARVAKGGELIQSIVSVGRESENVADEGDFIVRNDTGAREEYILKPADFQVRYVLSHDNYYVPSEKARIHALPITRQMIIDNRLEGLQALLDYPDKEIYIEAPWHESQALRLGDFLVTPQAEDKVYRIAQKEFHETYRCV